MSPWGRSLVFPSQSLTIHFGGGDADYALRVFLRHFRQLSAAGFRTADKILEVGPGRNLGTSVLMWALNHAANDVTLVYSQAAIEHVWNIADFWLGIIGLSKAGGYHSHQIDLADHGRRETNYIEMLERSPIGYWLTNRFVPGAINRWRASTHMTFLAEAGLKILSASRETREVLPITRSRVNRAFRSLDELDLRTTAVDLVALKTT
jgi:hypothetical protein